MSRRKKKHDEEHVSEAWLIPYADILTLLLALFIVLFSMGSISQEKFHAMSQAFNVALTGGTGFLDYESVVPPEFQTGTGDGEFTEDGKNGNDEIGENTDSVEQERLGQLQDKVEQYIEEKGLDGKLETSLTDEGLLLLIGDNVLFESGSADVRQKDVTIANEISELLVMSPPRNIIISGHTDNVPIGSARFASNWELSVMRAINFMKLVLRNDQLDPSMFSAKGFGEYKPIASNDTSEGRAKNRRVEILIMPYTYTNSSQ